MECFLLIQSDCDLLQSIIVIDSYCASQTLMITGITWGSLALSCGMEPEVLNV